MRFGLTSTITILCPEGIVLAADTRETTINRDTHEILCYRDNVKKIYSVKKGTNVGISCWGLAEVERACKPKKDTIPFLREFSHLYVKRGDTVDTISEKLKQCMARVTPPINDGRRMGFHVAGFVDGVPHLRHVFHEYWHAPGDYANENCHEEYHLSTGDKVLYKTRRRYPTLFNGDNLIANALFNYASFLQNYCGIRTSQLTLEECVKLARIIISVSIQRLDYFFDLRKFRKIPQTVGGGTKIAEITRTDGFKWI